MSEWAHGSSGAEGRGYDWYGGFWNGLGQVDMNSEVRLEMRF